MLRKIDKDAFRVLISLGVFFLFFGVGMVGIAISDELTMPPEGEVQSIDAEEIEQGVQSFEEGEDEVPALYPNHPPIDQIPSRMPYPPEEWGDQAAPPGSGAAVYHDAETEETVVTPESEAPKLDGFEQGGGYNGADGNNGTELWPAIFYDMLHITNTGDFPWRVNVKLVMRFGSDWYVASGTMVDAETVFTAGHCVYDHGGYGWADEIWVYPGWDGNGWSLPPPYTVENYGWGHSTHYASLVGWTESGNFDYDLGVIEITRGVGMLTGWFGWAYGGDCSLHLGLPYNNVSYPAECCNPPSCTLHNGSDMYYWYGNFDACPGNQLQLNTGGGGCFNTVWGGMSGSGAYFVDSGNRYVHAVSSTSNRSDRGWYCRQTESFSNYMSNTFIPDVRGSSFDLQALDVNAEPATIEAGQITTLLNHLATNPTNGSASGTWTFRVYLSTNDNISAADTLLSTQNYSWDFNVMSSVRINMVQVTIPADTPAGDYWLGVVYDSATDGNSANNDSDGWDASPITVFCPTPGTPSNPNPSDGATGVSINADLDWSDCSNTDSYDVYFGTSSSPPYYGNTSSSNYSLPTLNYSTHYYWKIVAKNDCGNSAPGPVWDFTTSSEPCPTPGTPSNPNPSDGATGVSINADLDWSDCSNTDSYDVYFGTSSSPPYYGNTSSSNYSLPTLNYSTHYYWKIVAKNDCGNSAPGPVWDFTTSSDINHDPELTSGDVDPDSGDDSTLFTYTVHYYDQDGDSPSTRYVYIDGSSHGSSHIMTLYSGSASDGTYRYQTTLSCTPDPHNYYFEFTDGQGGSDRLPSSGTSSGPDMNCIGLYQIVRPANTPISCAAEREFILPVEYDTSDGNNQLIGIGIRVHFNSSKLDWIGYDDVFTGATKDLVPVPDTSDYDGDPATDFYLGLAWFDINRQWPNTALPLRLADMRFRTENLPQGDTTQINFSMSSKDVDYEFQWSPATVVISPPCTLDIDGNGQYDALTDGILILRYLFGFRGDTLIDGAVAPDCTRCTAPEIEAWLADCVSCCLDIDGNGVADALTDGILILRYLFGFTGSTLIDGAVAPDCTRCTAPEIEAYIQDLMP